MDPSISHWSQEFKDIKHSFLLLLFILATFLFVREVLFWQVSLYHVFSLEFQVRSGDKAYTLAVFLVDAR